MPPRTKQPVVDPPDEPRKLSRVRTPKKQLVDVTCVLVAHDGAAWLPEALFSLAQSTYVPAHVVCVDTGSTDSSAELMAEHYDQVLRLPRDTGYGAAVAAALAAMDGREKPSAWVWLLHDDVAVESVTLQALMEQAESTPAAALLGPKVRDWDDPRVLVEVGLTTDAAGHRETGLERREYDQGQHDDVRDVLAIGTAGALVRRDVWDQVGGLDPELPVFRDDLDLGWKVNSTGHRVLVVPEARIRHVRAATTGRRETDAAPGRATGIDRRNALYVMLAHASWLRLVSLVPRLLLATVIRSLTLLLTRQVASAGDEWRALMGLLQRAGQLNSARAERTRLRVVPARQLRPLFASRWVRIRARIGVVTDWLGGSGAPMSSPLGALGDPGPDDEGDLEPSGSGALRRLFSRPGLQLFLALSVVTVVAERALIFSTGSLRGGALLPAPDGARDLWRDYIGAWHDVGVGTGDASPPGTAALAALSTLTFGRPSLALDVLLLASVPLAGLTAYLAASRLVRHQSLRLWAGATWALLPVATGVVAAGRLDSAAVQVALPLLALWAGRVLTADPRTTGWWRTWALALVLGITCAFAPLLWPVTAIALLVAAAVNLALTGGRRRALACVVVAAVPGALLFPWSWQSLQRPHLLFALPQVADPSLPAWHLVLLNPGGPGSGPAWVAVGLVAAGVVGTARRAFRRIALVCWAVALLCLAGALLLSAAGLDGRPLWSGISLQVAGLAVLVAALVAANGARSRLAGTSFGARQLGAALIALAALLTPVLGAVDWVVRGADGPVHRSADVALPAFAEAELQSSPGLRVLTLAPAGDSRLTYTVADSDGNELGSSGLRSDAAQRASLEGIVADLTSPRGSDAAEALSTRAVRYVGLRAGSDSEALAGVLDGQVGLVRRSTGSIQLWQVVAPAARLTVLEPDLGAQALAGARAPSRELLRLLPPTPIRAGPEGAHVRVPAGRKDRLLVLADATDPHWVATFNGAPMPRRTAWGWAQAFVLPSRAGLIELHYDQTTRSWELGLQAVVLVLVLILAAPGRRGRRGLDPYTDDDSRDSPDSPDSPTTRTPAMALDRTAEKEPAPAVSGP